MTSTVYQWHPDNQPSLENHSEPHNTRARPNANGRFVEDATELQSYAHLQHSAIPLADGLVAALFAVGYEIYLFKRLQGGDPVGILEVLAPALGIGLSLAALMWWLDPGTTYMPCRNWLAFAMRLNHLITIFSLHLPAVYVAKDPPASKLQDLVLMLFAPGWIVTAFLMAVAMPLPFLPTLILDAITIAMVPIQARGCCAISPYVEPLAGHFTAVLHQLLRPTIMHPLREKLHKLSSVGRCQTALATMWSLISLAGTACMSLELWAKRQQQDILMAGNRRRQGHSYPSLWARGGSIAAWLRLPAAARLLVYLLVLQLWAALILWICSLVVI